MNMQRVHRYREIFDWPRPLGFETTIIYDKNRLLLLKFVCVCVDIDVERERERNLFDYFDQAFGEKEIDLRIGCVDR